MEMGMDELSKLPNIGKTVEEQLVTVGIDTYDKLKEIGAKKAWLKIQEIDESACIHRLMALEGAIRGVKKNLLPDDVKKDLKELMQKKKRRLFLLQNVMLQKNRKNLNQRKCNLLLCLKCAYSPHAKE